MMLVFSRRKGERIRIGESVVLTVVHLSGGQVRLGFEAPVAVAIDREEVCWAKHQNCVSLEPTHELPRRRPLPRSR